MPGPPSAVVMTAVVIVARAVLAGVLGAAAAAKAVSPGGLRSSAVDLGVPERWAAPVAVAVPVGEAVAAVALLVPATATAGAVLALVLLGVFTAAVGRALAQGRHPVCRCFGGADARAVSGRTLARNLALLALAVLATGDPGDDPAVLVPLGLAALAAVAVVWSARRPADSAPARPVP